MLNILEIAPMWLTISDIEELTKVSTVKGVLT